MAAFEGPRHRVEDALVPEEVYYLHWRRQDMPFHSHVDGAIELNYVESGSCRYDIGDTSFTLEAKDLLILNGAAPHRLVVPDECVCMSINCLPAAGEGMMPAVADLRARYPALEALIGGLSTAYVVKNARPVYRGLREISTEFERGKDRFYLNLLATKSLLEVTALLTKDTSPAAAYVEKVKEYIQFHYFSIGSIEEIARQVTLNKVYLQRIFKQATGVPLWQYLSDVRMERAAQLLVGTDLPVGDIDEMVGMHSRHNFYIVFKKRFGMSPTAYRGKYTQK